MEYPVLSRVETLILRGASYGMELPEIAEALGLEQFEVQKEIADVYSKVHWVAGLWNSKAAIPRQNTNHLLPFASHT